jgi:hypothetical protein
MVSGLAFVDGTHWLANNKDKMQQILNKSMSFFALHDIQVNASKIVVMALNKPYKGTLPL